MADLLVPPPAGLAGYQPRLRYLLLEEQRFAAGELAPMRNLVAGSLAAVFDGTPGP